MVDWLALERKVDQLQAKAWGEAVRLSFFQDGQPDQSRPITDTRAVLHVGSDDSSRMEAGRGEGMRSRLAAGEGELFLDRSSYTGPIPRQGDRVRASARAGQPWFEVAMVGDHDTNMIVVTLTQA